MKFDLNNGLHFSINKQLRFMLKGKNICSLLQKKHRKSIHTQSISKIFFVDFRKQMKTYNEIKQGFIQTNVSS